jgi:rhamnogalacturonan endolyase
VILLKRHSIVPAIIVFVAVAILPVCLAQATTRYMENLDRGVVAVKVTTGVYVGWRMFGTDPAGIGFNVYRGTTKLNASPITTSTNYSLNRLSLPWSAYGALIT